MPDRRRLLCISILSADLLRQLFNLLFQRHAAEEVFDPFWYRQFRIAVWLRCSNAEGHNEDSQDHCAG